jgi:hypothetical protein
LRTEGKEINNQEEILQLLKAVWKPSPVAVIAEVTKGAQTMLVEETTWQIRRWQEGQ